MPQTVFITGCSSGIGNALAKTFMQAQWRVGVTARNLQDLNMLTEQGAIPFALDVTNESSMKTALESFVSRVGTLDMLINNAGYGAMGPLAEMPLSEIRKQMETNLTGQLALIQIAVPHMIRQKSGRIVNMGSVSGVLPTPFSGAYAASKAALHAASDALRLELSPFGIEVITVQPGGIASKFADNAEKTLNQTTQGLHHFAAAQNAISRRTRISQEGAMDLELFAQKLTTILTREKIPPLIRLGTHSRLLPFLAKWFPFGIRDTILKRKFALDDSISKEAEEVKKPGY